MKNDDLNEQAKQRRIKLQALCDSGINPYPNQFRRNNTVSDVFGNHARSTSEELESDTSEVRLAGRLVSRRIMGKASFAHIRDGSGDIQLYVQRQDLPEGVYESFKKYDLGDILGAVGTVFRTKTGELSIRVHEIYLLVKSLHPLPEKFHGLTDIETRYRQRYLDLMVNQDSREVFRRRSVIVRAFRDFLDKRGYLEIESPITLPIPGGANARPFVTHHNTLDMKLYLRIAQELAIKRCLVGGFDKVYELNRNFRNEGLSSQHNPEFTMLEYNETYLDYLDYMTFTEDMLSYVTQEVAGTLEVAYQEDVISFRPPFSRMTLSESIAYFNQEVTVADCSNIDALQEISNSLNLSYDGDGAPSIGKLLMAIFEETVEEKLIQPTFITEYPLEVSPLSRRNDTRSDIADRFELFVAGKELANGFSELNDPDDQAKRFSEQARAKETGDDEAMFYDADYIKALEYGMPPNAGGGIGIDRLVMVLTNQASIRDVLLFPHMRPHKPSDEG